MLRKIAAGTSAAVVVAGLAAAPAVAAGLPASPGTALPGGAPRTPGCGDATRTEHHTAERPRFVFGPLADVPHLRSAGPSCEIATPVVTDFSGAHRSASPPDVGTPAPEVPGGPGEGSPPEAPAPVDSGPSPSAGPPADTSGPPGDTAGPPGPPDIATPAPPPVAPTPPPAPRAPSGGPGESVLPETQPPAGAPTRLPQTAGDTGPLTVAGGASLVAAGLAWIGGARRRRKRPATG